MERIAEDGEFTLDDLQAAIDALHNPGSSSELRERANVILEQFVQRLDVFDFIIPLFSELPSPFAKFYMIKCLRNATHKLWKTLSEEKSNEIKQFIFDLIPREISQKSQKFLINECNEALADIVIEEWPQVWETFLQDLFESGSISEEVHMNTFDILMQLSQKMQTQNPHQISPITISNVTKAISENIDTIIEYIHSTFSDATTAEHINEVLKCLPTYFQFMNPQSLFESNILKEVCENYLPNEETCINAINVIAQAISLSSISEESKPHLVELFDTIVNSLYQVIGPNYDALNTITGNEHFVDSFIRAITSFLIAHSSLVANEEHEETYSQILRWLYGMTISATGSTYKVLIEYWNSLTRWLCISKRGGGEVPELYYEIFHMLRPVLVERMPTPIKPTRYIDADEEEHECMKSTAIYGSFFSMARECIVGLTNLDQEDTVGVILKRFEEMSEGVVNIKSLGSLCWATGAVSGALPMDDEEEFFPAIMQNLFALSDSMEEIENRIMCAKGICFISSQFYKLLMKPTGYVVLRAVVEKIIEFLGEDDLGLQAYALDALKTFSHRCKPSIIQQGPDGSESILSVILSNLDSLFGSLSIENMPDFYEILAILVQGIADESQGISGQAVYEDLIDRIIEAAQSASSLEEYQRLMLLIRSLSKLALYLKGQNSEKICEFIDSIIGYYLEQSRVVNQAFEAGEVTPIIRCIMAVRSEVLIFLERMLNFGNNPDISREHILPQVFSTVLEDYANSIPDARCLQVIAMVTAIMQPFSSEIADQVPIVLGNLYAPTLEMVQDSTNATLLQSFYRFVSVVCTRQGLLNALPPDAADDITRALMGGGIIPLKAVSDASLHGLSDIVRNAAAEASSDEAAMRYMERNYIEIVRYAFGLITDPAFKFSFNVHSRMLREFLKLNVIREHVDDVFMLLTEMFPGVDPHDLSDLLQRLMDNGADPAESGDIIREFACSVSRMSAYDPDLNRDSLDEMAKQLKAELAQIPGFVAPYDQPPNDTRTRELACGISGITII